MALHFRLMDRGKPIWSPDGGAFMVEKLDPHADPAETGYLVSLEDGSITLLYEGGVILGTIQIP